MNERAPTGKRGWVALTPETWREDLLRVVLRVVVVLGSVVYVPSVIFSLKSAMIGVAVLDTVCLAALVLLTLVKKIPATVRTGGTCLIMYALAHAKVARRKRRETLELAGDHRCWKPVRGANESTARLRAQAADGSDGARSQRHD
ncbi:MAG: hypothetical protein IPK60_00075 [Sandaracinaceae bacterium]|nr:hypothetical protein [Sandaracinaceae bacterium]